MRGTLEACLSTNYVLPHHGPADAGLDRVRATAQVDPSEKRGDDSQRLDNSNAMVHDDMNPLVLSYSHL